MSATAVEPRKDLSVTRPDGSWDFTEKNKQTELAYLYKFARESWQSLSPAVRRGIMLDTGLGAQIAREITPEALDDFDECSEMASRENFASSVVKASVCLEAIYRLVTW